MFTTPGTRRQTVQSTVAHKIIPSVKKKNSQRINQRYEKKAVKTTQSVTIKLSLNIPRLSLDRFHVFWLSIKRNKIKAVKNLVNGKVAIKPKQGK